MTPNLVEMSDVRVRLGDKDVLRGVTANLARGKITALIGLNGSGKTTLLRAVLREVPCTGTIRFRCGHDHSRPAPEYVGYVPQRLAVEATLPLTVGDLLALALQRRPLFLGIGRATRRTMEEMLRNVGLAPRFLDSLVAKLSGGELQRVLLALALHPRPELLLLDEPAAGVDFQYEEALYELLERVNRETGVTVLLVSHELNVVSKRAHHVLCLKDGRIECQGPPGEVVTGEAIEAVFGARKGLYAHDHGPHG
jgi:zinc transport system ATP-binding protein